ncbi:Mobile element protein [Enterococcus sp. 5H]|nr:Mobile element protein [Enterococcus sp. 5H]
MMAKKYNNDFRKTIVELYQSGTSVNDLSREYGVSSVTIYSWLKRLSPINEEGMTSDDITELIKENQRLKEDNDILKKAMTIFAKK